MKPDVAMKALPILVDVRNILRMKMEMLMVAGHGRL